MTPDVVRKLAHDLIFEDLRRSGLAGTQPYDISNIPAWFFFGATDDEFVERAFRVILNRPPPLSADISHFKAAFAAGLSRAQWLLDLVNSAELMANASRATDHIRVLASAGLAWQEALASAELDRQRALALAGATDDEFVERSYRLILNRAPSSAEISIRKAPLAAGMLSRAQWLLEVSNSAESMAIANRSRDHVRALASAELAWQKALASAELDRQRALALAGATDDEFVDRSYRLILNRAPSSAEISIHKSALAAGMLSRAQCLLDFVNSAESMANASRATDYIRALASAELAWQEALASAELDRQRALALAGATDDEFVERSYRLILNRAPSSAEISMHKAPLAAGMLSRAQWLLEVSNSAELMAIANRSTDHIRALASAELAWQKALASAELDRQRPLVLAVRSRFSRILNKLKSPLDASFGVARELQTLRAGVNDVRTTSADHLSLIARELQTLREGLNDVRTTSADHLSLIARELQTLRAGVNDVRTTSADHLSLIARELQTLREGLNDVRTTSADHLSLIARELQTLREGLNDVLRTTHPYCGEKPYDREKKPFLLRSRQSPTELPAAVSGRELNLAKQRILTELDSRYRGSEQALKAQLEFYLPRIQEISELGTVVDVGCGRGTFLEMMRDHQIDAIGLEINEDQIEECRRKKVDVRLIDALEFMRRSEADQYGAITLFHVIEHLDFDTLVTFLMEAYRVVAPGGIVLMETPNAENLYVSTYMFNVDPTHVKPITYQYISTVLEVLGFECERLPVSASVHEDDGGETGNRHLNYLLAVSANLSVVARKPRGDS